MLRILTTTGIGVIWQKTVNAKVMHTFFLLFVINLDFILKNHFNLSQNVR